MRLIPLSLTLILLITLFLCPVYATDQKTEGSSYYHGVVLEVLEDTIDEDNFVRIQKVVVSLNDSSSNKKQVTINHQILLTSINQIVVKPQDQVIIWAKSDDTNLDYCKIYSYTRDRFLTYLLGIFLVVIILIGGRNGIASILSLVITLTLVFVLFFPMILNEYNPLLSAIIVCVLSTFATLMIIGKSDIKTFSALFGSLGGVLVAGFLTYIFGYLTRVQGISDESAELLSYLSKGRNLDFKELLFAGIIIGSLGAIMDVAMSISSAMDEIVLSCHRISSFELFRAGMRIGKDIMGTMTNTLILAYVGSSINILLVYYMYELSFTQFVNSEQIASEILRSLSGSIGLILSIPITALSYVAIRKHYHLK